MKRLIIISLVLSLISGISAKAGDFKSIIDRIDTEKLQHPYGIFDQAGKEAILKKIADDPRYAERLEFFKQSAEAILVRTPEQEKQPVLRDYDARAKMISDPYDLVSVSWAQDASLLALMYQLTGDERFAEKSFHYASKACMLDSWMSGAHTFRNIYKRVWPYGADDNQVVFLYDIYAAMVSNLIAMTYDWIYEYMSKEQRDAIRSGLLQNTIIRIAGAYDYHWWTNASRCNWSGINHSAAGNAALIILKENPELKWVVERSCEGLSAMMDNVDEDGGWQEGRHYYNFGMRESFDFIDALCHATGGELDFFQREPLKSHPVDFMLYGLTGNFCDSDQTGPDMTRYATSHMVQRTGDPTAAYFLENFYPDNPFKDGGFLDLIYFKPDDVKAVKPAEASRHFRGIDWAFMRKDFGDEYVQVATKAGKADDPHHGHLDIGTFNISWMGETVIGEFKRTFYDLKVFDEERFDYLHVRSQGHNVVLVNDRGQQMSKHKDKAWGHIYQGKITGYSSEPAYGWVAMDNTGAYAEGDMGMWKRWIVLDKERNGVIVMDQVGCNKGDAIDLLFHPMVGHSIDQKNRSVSLDGEKAHMRMKALATSPISIREVEQKFVMQMTGFVPVDIPCYSVHADASAQTTCFASIFYPDGTKVRAAIGSNPAKPTVDITVDGKRIRVSATDGEIKIF